MNMSNSRLFLDKDGEDGAPAPEFQASSEPPSSSSASSEDHNHDHQESELVLNGEKNGKESNNIKESEKKMSLGELKATDATPDGLKTQTCSDHKIPEMKEADQEEENGKLGELKAKDATPDGLKTPKLSDRKTPEVKEDDHEDQKQGQEESNNKEREKKKISLGELNATDDDDGFKTPTSLENKIPEMKECPPAPRKPIPTFKRKPRPVPSSLQNRFDMLESFDHSRESFDPNFHLPTNFFADLELQLRCIKKARPEDHSKN